MILQQLMARVGPESKPCDYFDMTGGTSNGGLIAIMLGRLRMTVDECINAYTTLSDRVVEKKHHRFSIKGNLQGRFDAAELERAVKRILVERGLDEETLLLEGSPEAPCKVFVCATSKDAVCLMSYPSPRGRKHLLESTTIWQACRATSAATSFFDPIAIGPFGEWCSKFGGHRGSPQVMRS
ncbi:acyl transferase/acyl hydrolase/lysophospholipase [Lasiosphaeria ovina]|uniref:Acyl transferase/acyl hydrolase/lysophospholipase n=1 Tax=Lasiosphaeria ovina TaxID=92902 RepID=A0AAE0KI22_9PEZI|nr:acyl transferase/acyl hydrolase/lysophospholipase [Lasiosphaeria ovina]